MKKKGLIIASLLVLVMSFMFIGCPDGDPEETENDPTVSPAAITALKAFGYTDADNLPVPAGGNFDTYKSFTMTIEDEGEEEGEVETYHAAAFAILWDKCSEEILATYKTAWGNKVNSIQVARMEVSDKSFSLKTNTLGTGIVGGQVIFTPDGGTQDGVTIKANSIVFILMKQPQ